MMPRQNANPQKLVIDLQHVDQGQENQHKYHFDDKEYEKIDKRVLKEDIENKLKSYDHKDGPIKTSYVVKAAGGIIPQEVSVLRLYMEVANLCEDGRRFVVSAEGGPFAFYSPTKKFAGYIWFITGKYDNGKDFEEGDLAG